MKVLFLYLTSHIGTLEGDYVVVVYRFEELISLYSTADYFSHRRRLQSEDQLIEQGFGFQVQYQLDLDLSTRDRVGSLLCSRHPLILVTRRALHSIGVNRRRP